MRETHPPSIEEAIDTVLKKLPILQEVYKDKKGILGIKAGEVGLRLYVQLIIIALVPKYYPYYTKLAEKVTREGIKITGEIIGQYAIAKVTPAPETAALLMKIYKEIDTDKTWWHARQERTPVP